MIDRRIAFLSIAIAGLAAPLAASQAAGQSARQAAGPNRADLAAAYLAFEEALAAADLTGPRQRHVHRHFDYAASLFFAARFADAIERIDDLTWFVEEVAAVEAGGSRSAGRAVRSLSVRFHPAVHTLDRSGERALRAMIYSKYSFPVDEDIVLALVGSHGEEIWRRAVMLNVRQGRALQRIELEDLPEDLAEGTYRAVIVDRAGHKHIAGRLSILHRPLEEVKNDLQARLDAARELAAEDDADLQRAIDICAARLRVLTPTPSPLNSIEFLLDPWEHAREVEAEIDAIAAGHNPYRRRGGEHWRVAARSSGESPLMVHAPQAAAQGEPMPLVFALHGAGGDETLFMRAYGAGKIRDLADSRGFIVATPLTYHVMADAAIVDRIIDDLSADYAIDLDRIYLIGHSLGGGTASALLARDPARFAAAVCIAGAAPFSAPDDGAPHPPVLVIAAELDTIITPQRLRDVADAGIKRGLPIEYRLEKNLGHVLVVNEVLEDAIDWLLRHRK